MSPTPSTTPNIGGDAPELKESKNKDDSEDTFSKQLEKLSKEIDKIDLDHLKQNGEMKKKQGNNNTAGVNKVQGQKNDRGKIGKMMMVLLMLAVMMMMTMLLMTMVVRVMMMIAMVMMMMIAMVVMTALIIMMMNVI